MAHKCSARELSLGGDIFLLRERKPRRAAANGRLGPPYEELVIPQTMERWAVGPGKLTGLLIPDPEMANVYSKGFYEALGKGAPYTPFAIHKLREKPWPPPPRPPKPRTRC